MPIINVNLPQNQAFHEHFPEQDSEVNEVEVDLVFPWNVLEFIKKQLYKGLTPVQER